VFPNNFCHENKEGDDDAEEQPPINELHVGRLWQRLRNSLVLMLQNLFSSSLNVRQNKLSCFLYPIISALSNISD
jgi:hypothetical protein